MFSLGPRHRPPHWSIVDEPSVFHGGRWRAGIFGRDEAQLGGRDDGRSCERGRLDTGVLWARVYVGRGPLYSDSRYHPYGCCPCIRICAHETLEQNIYPINLQPDQIVCAVRRELVSNGSIRRVWR